MRLLRSATPVGRHPSRGSTMLYVGGIVAVAMILLFGLTEQSIAHTHHVGSLVNRARAEWLLRGGYVILSAPETRLPSKEKLHLPVRTGNLQCTVEHTSAGLALLATASVPRDNPRLSVIAKWLRQD